MIKSSLLYALIAAGSSSLCYLVSCKSDVHTSVNEATNHPRIELQGYWRYDSTRTIIYTSNHQISSSFGGAIQPDAFLSIGPAQWIYTGSIHEEHGYHRQADTLLMRRIGDKYLADNHYILPENIGKGIGILHKIIIKKLSSHHLVVCDSSQDSEGDLRSSYGYYSR